MARSKYIKQIENRSVVQQVIDALTEAMIDGALVPGDKLPSEPELAKQFGIGRSSIREAIKILEYMGVLESKRAEGTFVSSGFHESLIDPMVYGIILGNRENFTHLMELRQMIEAGITRLAIINKDEEGMKNLKSHLLVMQDIADLKDDKKKFNKLFKADDDFHNYMSKLCKNPLADKIARVVRTLTYSTRYETVKQMVESGRAHELVDAHWELFDMIKEGSFHDLEDKIYRTYFLDDIEIEDKDQ